MTQAVNDVKVNELVPERFLVIDKYGDCENYFVDDEEALMAFLNGPDCEDLNEPYDFERKFVIIDFHPTTPRRINVNIAPRKVTL